MPNFMKKKKGNSRISRLFSDLQTPPKRGGSLVVETGFPTSIIDLFVKNRDRLKKKKQPTSTTTTTTIEEKEEVEVEACLDSDLELEVKNNENICVELDNKCYKVEGNDGNERLDGGSFGYKVICLSGLMGLCVLYSKGFVLLLSICALLLLLFEFVGKLNLLKFKWVFDGVIRRVGVGGCSGVGLEHGVKLEIVNERDGCGLDVSDCDVKGEIEEVIELNDACEMTKNSNFDSDGECGNVLCKRGIIERGGENEGECCKMVVENGKTKKGKKFWKRCMFRSVSKKMKHRKHGKETHLQSCESELLTTCIVSNTGELDEDGRREERKLDDTNNSSLSSSFDKVVEQRREEFVNLEKHSSGIGKRLNRQNMRTKSCRMVVYRGLNIECLAVMAIALAGLIDSRILALVLTLSCVGFKFIRSL